MRQQYSPSFLVQAEITSDQASVAAANNMTQEELCRKAIAFFAAQCVHTQGKRRRAPKSK